MFSAFKIVLLRVFKNSFFDCYDCCKRWLKKILFNLNSKDLQVRVCESDKLVVNKLRLP